jgi:two-component system osmolarity sensor histidine kinase EnvZ
MWMLGSSLVLIGVAVLFMRNQIRPIQHLAFAAEAFGKGRDISFRPHGAREVRLAGQAFLEMKQRIERSLAQRTTMLNGVSHDLRTILTRFKLSLEFLPAGEDKDAMTRDVDEMIRMLEAYLAFARGDETDEKVSEVNLKTVLEELKNDCMRVGRQITVNCADSISIAVRPDAFRRLLSNLVSNAVRHAETVVLTASYQDNWLTVQIDDDGPGVPEKDRENIFKPFVRLDEARNQAEGGSGLGLTIARDLARSHGGDVTMFESPLGGLRATVRIPA